MELGITPYDRSTKRISRVRLKQCHRLEQIGAMFRAINEKNLKSEIETTTFQHQQPRFQYDQRKESQE